MRVVALTLLLLVPLLAGCATTEREPADVLASFYPLGFLAERIANGTLAVEVLVPPGVEPHEWEATAQDVARASDAKIMLAQGAGFEPWLLGMREALGSRAPPVAYMTAGMTLRDASDDHEDGEHENETDDGGELTALDPHTWLDPALFQRQSQLAESAMAAAFPEKEAALRAEGARLREELAALDAAFVEGLATCDVRTIIANHDAYAYMGERYDFDVVAISGLSPEAEPSPQDLARAIDAAREHNATIIFFEELVSPQVAEAVAREVGATTRVLSPLEGLTAAQRAAGEDYFSVMRQNLANLREAMRCA